MKLNAVVRLIDCENSLCTLWPFVQQLAVCLCWQSPRLSKRWRGMWSVEPRDGIYKLSLSPDGKLVAAIHYSSILSIWHVPSLMLKQSWQLGLQVIQPFLHVSSD